MKKLIAFQCLAALIANGAPAQDTTATEPDTAYVEYGDRPLTLPLGIGVRTPSYDRVNGLTLPWGPRLTLGVDKVEMDALVSYRSHLGKWDPSVEGFLRPGHRNEVRFFVGRTTFSNDAWIRSDLINSAATLFVGSDARNYYRVDRAAARLTHSIVAGAMTFRPFIGGSVERDWSTGSVDPQKIPWSVFGRTHRLKMRRPNPPVVKGRITSILGGTGLEFYRGELEARLDVTVEQALKAPIVQTCVVPPGGPICTEEPDSFTQGTIHGTVFFPTFGVQTFAFRTHAVLTGGNHLLPQRYAYLGGTATLPTVDLLAFGGDRLFFAEGEYTIPVERVVIQRLGSPFIAFRYAVGAAGVRNLPLLVQNLGAGVGISFFRVDYHIDPASNRSPFSRRSTVAWGVSIPR